jgi:hypothetical protein
MAYELKDSGARREFESGAVRDAADGKGRCDLLPLQEVAEFYSLIGNEFLYSVFDNLASFQNTREVDCLYEVINLFIDDEDAGYGVERGYQQALLGLSHHYAAGAEKYGDNNWRLGVPLHVFIDSGIRHLLKHVDGQVDERHDLAVLWNFFGAAWTIKNYPELDDFSVIYFDDKYGVEEKK